MLGLVSALNHLRRENPALQVMDNVTFLDTANEALVGYAKQSPGNCILSIVSLDPFGTQEGLAVVPASLGLPPSFAVTDLLTGEEFRWRIGPNYVRLSAGERQAHVLRVHG